MNELFYFVKNFILLTSALMVVSKDKLGQKIPSDFNNVPVIFEKPREAWSETLGDDGDESITACLESDYGYIAVCGNARQQGKSSQIMFALIRPSVTERVVLAQHYYGNEHEAGATAMIQTRDGGYAISGYYSEEAGKPRPCLLKLDEEGDLMSQTVVPYPVGNNGKTGQFNSLVQLKNRDIIAVGTYNNNIFLTRFDEEGKLKGNSVLLKPGSAKAIALAPAGDEIMICGQYGKSGPGFYIKTDTTLKQNKVIKSGLLESANAVFYDTQLEQYCMVGESKLKSGAKKTRGFRLVTIKGDEEKTVYEYFGNRSIYIRGIVQLPSSVIAIGGYSQDSFAGYSNDDHDAFLTYLEKTNIENTLFSEVETFSSRVGKGKKDDQLLCMSLSYGGSLLIGGSTYSISEGNDLDGFLKKISHEKKESTTCIPKSNELSIEEVQLHEAEKDNRIGAGERGYFTVKIRNNGDCPFQHLSAQTSADPKVPGLSFFRKIYIEKIKGNSEKHIRIPLRGASRLHTDSTTVSIAIVNSEGIEIARYNHPMIATKSESIPILHIDKQEFITKNTPADRDEYIELKVTLKNKGGADLNNIVVNFNMPYQVEPVNRNEEIQEIKRIVPGDSVLLRIKFRASPFYFDDYIPISCVAFEKNRNTSSSKFCFVKLRSFLEEERGGGEFIRVPAIEEWYKEQNGPNPGYSLILKPEKNCIKWWYEEGWKDLDTNGISDWSRSTMVVKARIFTKEKIKEGDISIKNTIVGKPKLARLPKKKHGYYEYVFYAKISFKKGTNNITIETPCGKSPTLKVFYKPPDYHIFCVGVKYNDLKYTGKDARDIDTILCEQEDSYLYGDLKTNILLTGEQNIKETEAQRLRTFLNPYTKKKALNVLQHINKNEIVFLYLSVHGDSSKIDNMNEDQFYISPSDYIANDTDSMLDFDKCFIDKILKVIPLQAYIFIDACQSGKAVDIASKQIKGKVNTENPFAGSQNLPVDSQNPFAKDSLYQLQMISSCTANQKSGELDSLQNGIFTHALCNILLGKNCKFGEKKKITFLSMGNVFNELKNEVENLCKEYSCEIMTPQISKGRHTRRFIQLKQESHAPKK